MSPANGPWLTTNQVQRADAYTLSSRHLPVINISRDIGQKTSHQRASTPLGFVVQIVLNVANLLAKRL